MTHSILLSGCGGAGRHVAQVATAGGRAEVTGLFDPNIEHVKAVQQLYPAAATGDDLRFGYVDASGSNRYVFALFSGRTREGGGGRHYLGRFDLGFTTWHWGG